MSQLLTPRRKHAYTLVWMVSTLRYRVSTSWIHCVLCSSPRRAVAKPRGVQPGHRVVVQHSQPTQVMFNTPMWVFANCCTYDGLVEDAYLLLPFPCLLHHQPVFYRGQKNL